VLDIAVASASTFEKHLPVIVAFPWWLVNVIEK
jgi:hypothetical protein